MATLLVRVPDGDSCSGCDFLSTGYSSNHYQSSEYYKCLIFKCECVNKEKCVACKMLSLRKEDKYE
jgi:hypothetical protein